MPEPVVSDALRRVALADEIKKLRRIIQDLERSPGGVGSPRRQRIYQLTLILTGMDLAAQKVMPRAEYHRLLDKEHDLRTFR